jgi:hypothetical protein
MRVNGNISPDVLSIEDYEPIPGKVEVRLRENINEVEKTDEMTGETITLYEYDEYSFILDNEKNLRKKIQNHIEDWLTTGRTLEVAPNATLYVSAKSDAIDEYTNELIEEGLL